MGKKGSRPSLGLPGMTNTDCGISTVVASVDLAGALALDGAAWIGVTKDNNDASNTTGNPPDTVRRAFIAIEDYDMLGLTSEMMSILNESFSASADVDD